MWIKSGTESIQPIKYNWVAIDWEVVELIKKVDIIRLDEA